MLLALDPGLNSPGVALFRGDTLAAAGRVPIPGAYAALPDGRRWLEVAQRIADWVIAPRGYCGLYDTGERVTAVIFERPQWYQRAKSKGDPNQLAGVAGVAANVTGIFAGLRHLDVHSPTPAQWIGQLSKVCPTCKGKAKKKKCADCRGSAWMTPRGRRIRSRLSLEEFKLVPDQNDAIDSVGIGLWALNRLEPKRTFSNGKQP